MTSQERVIGDLQGPNLGPLVLLVGSMHGNEPAGVKAIQQVMAALQPHQSQMSGRVVGLWGNRLASQQDKRYLQYDLNRCWTPESWQRLLAKDRQEWYGEDQEYFELYTLIRELSQGNYTLKVCADLHTTSAKNGNFIVVPDEEADSSVLRSMHLPIVVDLHKYLHGTLLQYLFEHDYLAFAMEGGQHLAEEAVHLHTAGIWELLRATGVVESNLVDSLNPYPKVLSEVAAVLPDEVHVRYHHRVGAQDGFVMRPGYISFMEVKKDEHLADDANGKILAPCDGLIFMPLYQPQGEDGFFIVAPLN